MRALETASVISRPFGGLTSASDGIVNVTIGATSDPSRARPPRPRGFATSRSPVGTADQVFNKVDLSSWTSASAEQWAKLQFAEASITASGRPQPPRAKPSEWRPAHHEGRRAHRRADLLPRVPILIVLSGDLHFFFSSKAFIDELGTKFRAAKN